MNLIESISNLIQIQYNTGGYIIHVLSWFLIANGWMNVFHLSVITVCISLLSCCRSSLLGTDFQMGHQHSQHCWLLQTTWKAFVSSANRYIHEYMCTHTIWNLYPHTAMYSRTSQYSISSLSILCLALIYTSIIFFLTLSNVMQRLHALDLSGHDIAQ